MLYPKRSNKQTQFLKCQHTVKYLKNPNPTFEIIKTSSDISNECIQTVIFLTWNCNLPNM